MMTDRIDRLEQTILDMGSEIFRLRHTLESMEDTQSSLLEFIKTLRGLLVDKGLVSADDFDDISDLKMLRDLLDPHGDYDMDQYAEEAVKKSSH